VKGIYTSGPQFQGRLVYGFVSPGCLPASVGPDMSPPPPLPDCHIWIFVDANTGARLEGRNGPGM
jgi:hypothetical protein